LGLHRVGESRANMQVGRMGKSFMALMLAAISTSGLWAQSRELAGIAHVAFHVADLSRSLSFYGKLGFEQAFGFADAGKTTEAFIKINDRQLIELYPRAADSQALGLTHVCFEVNDIQSLYAAYRNEDLHPPEVKKARAGNLLFTIHDPEGQLIEYTQYLPESLHSADRGKHLGARVSQHLVGAGLVVRDPRSERAFYLDKLGFEETPSGAMELRAPGGSGEMVTFQPASPGAKPRIIFSVRDVRNAGRELGRRGFAVLKDSQGIAVSDPDGVLVVFTLQGSVGRRPRVATNDRVIIGKHAEATASK
jgi:catechol 2,3-dioxygenase-like lactoylglutathione lyase family enzyme